MNILFSKVDGEFAILLVDRVKLSEQPVLPVFNPKMVVCKVHADEPDPARAHVGGECHADVGRVSVVGEFVVDNFDAADFTGYLEGDDGNFRLPLFLGRVRKEIFCSRAFDILETVAFVLRAIVDVKQIGGMEESTDVVDSNRRATLSLSK